MSPAGTLPFASSFLSCFVVNQSCNVYFWELAEEVGIERINRYAEAFGFAERTGIGVNSEAEGFLATREWYEEHYGAFRIGYTLNTAIGQGNTRVTVLQLALAYAAIANGGTVYRPRLARALLDADGSVVERFDAERLSRWPNVDGVFAATHTTGRLVSQVKSLVSVLQ